MIDSGGVPTNSATTGNVANTLIADDPSKCPALLT